MNTAMILHHYENSPYAEKIRLMLGHTNSDWCSLISPAWPPRPNVDPLSGGYRRIPIAQIGADIFCDSALIANEIAEATGHPELAPSSASGDALALMQMAEADGFFAAITSIPTPKLLGTMLRNFGPIGMFKFIKDRSGILKGGTSSAPAAEDARAVMASLFQSVDAMLSEQAWLAGDAPSIADFAVYHPIWLHINCSGSLPAELANARAWYERVSAIGQGNRREISQEEAFEQARSSDPRPVPENDRYSPFEMGKSVEVSPEDYGVVPVQGEVAAITTDRIVLSRQTDQFGTVHVHFPRAGYAIKPVS